MSFVNYAAYSGGATDTVDVRRTQSFRPSHHHHHGPSARRHSGAMRTSSTPVAANPPAVTAFGHLFHHQQTLTSLTEDDGDNTSASASGRKVSLRPNRESLSSTADFAPSMEQKIVGEEEELFDQLQEESAPVNNSIISKLRKWRRHLRHFWSLLRQQTGSQYMDYEADESAMQSSRHKPESLEVLVKMTNFSKQELQLMYRGFKQHCPSGMVSEETFKDIFAHFFPQGDSDEYAHLVFRIFDTSKTGMVTFEQFVMALSILSRGSTDDRLRWTFTLYDVNKDGFITRDDMQRVVTSIYHMMGKWCTPNVNDGIVESHVDHVFKQMDLNKDGMITLDEFMTSCKMDENIIRSMSSLDTVL